MAKRKEETSFVQVVKSIGTVLAPILGVGAFFNYFNKEYLVHAIVLTIIAYYFIWLEVRIKRIEKRDNG